MKIIYQPETMVGHRTQSKYWAARGMGYVDTAIEAHHYTDEEALDIKKQMGDRVEVRPVPKYEGQLGSAGYGVTAPRVEDKTNLDTEDHMREYTSAERKAMPIDAGCLQYFPDALAAVARVSVKGNEKHNPGQPLHWSRGKSNDHAECVTRHRLTPDAIDPETGEPHRNHALWRLLAEVQIAEEKRLIAAGIKPLSGVTS